MAYYRTSFLLTPAPMTNRSNLRHSGNHSVSAIGFCMAVGVVTKCYSMALRCAHTVQDARRLPVWLWYDVCGNGACYRNLLFFL
jgi:hypothetical protein